jgi:outer membrane protein assembly factor BamB
VAGSRARVEFNVDNQPGRIRLPDGYEPAQFSVIADYAMAGTPDAGARVFTRRYWLPAFTPAGQTPTPTGVAGGAAVGTDDTVYYATGNGYLAAAQFVGGIPVLKWKLRTANANQFTGQSNIVDPRNREQFRDYQFISAPAVGNDMVYFAGQDGVLYALETTTSFTVKVPSPSPAGGPQKAPMSSARGANLILYSNEATQPRTNRVPPDSYIVNADSGTVTITNFRNLTLDLSQARPYPQLGGRYGIALDVDYIDINGNQVQDVTYLPLNLVYTFSTAQFGRQDRFFSSPVIAGDRVYVASERGLLYELPADPRGSDPKFRAETDLGSYRNGALVRTREVSPLFLLAPPVVGNGTVAVATTEGVTCYQAPRISVADGNRIVEVAADSTALSATEATEKHHLVNSDFPIPADPQSALLPAGAQVVTAKKEVNRPARVIRLNRQKSITSAFFSSNVTEEGTVGVHSEIAETSTLVADTGNNRVVEYNPAGKVVWELSSFQDPFRLLPSGESLKLSEPHDVQRWVDTAPDPQNASGPPLLVFHTLIADTGNGRVLEIVDKIRYRLGQFTPESFVTLPGQVDPLVSRRRLVLPDKRAGAVARLPHGAARADHRRVGPPASEPRPLAGNRCPAGVERGAVSGAGAMGIGHAREREQHAGLVRGQRAGADLSLPHAQEHSAHPSRRRFDLLPA